MSKKAVSSAPGKSSKFTPVWHAGDATTECEVIANPTALQLPIQVHDVLEVTTAKGTVYIVVDSIKGTKKAPSRTHKQVTLPYPYTNLCKAHYLIWLRKNG